MHVLAWRSIISNPWPNYTTVDLIPIVQIVSNDDSNPNDISDCYFVKKGRIVDIKNYTYNKYDASKIILSGVMYQYHCKLACSIKMIKSYLKPMMRKIAYIDI